jgi:amidophosphoribosyltransferase
MVNAPMVKDSLRDKCGVFGIWGAEKPAEYVYLGLHNLQHRGQESCGIVSTSQRKFYSHYGMGIVNEVFNDEILRELGGRAAVGHNRYSTKGSSSIENAQPLVANTKNGTVAIAHNGQFANYRSLKAELRQEGCIFKTDSDSEIVLHRFARAGGDSIEEIIRASFDGISPAYSIVMLTKKELLAIRDPEGVRPLVIGELKGSYIVASESVAFDIMDASYIDEVKPGELILINDRGLHRRQLFAAGGGQQCVFEHVYFARPDSFLFGSAVTTSEIRKEFGRLLFGEHPADADVVIPVPDSSMDAALGFAESSGIPFDLGLIRSHYIGRTFIEPTQAIRDAKVRKKYNPNRTAVVGKRVVVVEDSIVRGTTLKNLVKILQSRGAREVHVRVSSPPYRHSCYLGIDTAETKHLVAHRFNVEEIREFLGATSLGYLSQEAMLSNRYLKGKYCHFCFDGERRIKKR